MFREEKIQINSISSHNNQIEPQYSLVTNKNNNNIDYWRSKLSNITRLNLAGNNQEKNKANINGKQLSFQLDKTLLEQIEYYGKTNHINPKFFFLSALYTTLLQYNQDPDITLGTIYPQNNSKSAAFNTETIPLRINHFNGGSFAELIATYAACENEATDHALSMNELFKVLDFQERSIFKKNVPYQILLDVNELDESTVDREKGCPFEYFGINLSQGKCLIDFNTKIFDDHFINNFFSHFENILKYAISNPKANITTFPRVLEAERKKIAKYNNNIKPMTRGTTLLNRFQNIAKAEPSRKFLCFHEKSTNKTFYTYQQINQEANQIAHYLASLSLPKNAYVGLALERSPRFIVAVLAALKAGITFVPLDTSPSESLNQKLADPNISHIITDKTCRRLLNNTNTNATISDLDATDVKNTICLQPTSDLNDLPIDAIHGAYKMYTSGSTDKPKGIIIPFAGLNNLHLGLMHQPFPDGAQIMNNASHCFDAFYFDLALAIAKKGTVHLTPEPERHDASFLNRVIRDNRINVGVFVPDLFAKLNPQSPLTHIIVMGSSPNKSVLTAWLNERAVKAGRKIMNGYGPTENTIASTLGLYQPGQDANCIGRVLCNMQLFCVDSKNQIVPIDVEGEIWLAGPGLALRYDHLPEMTNDKFMTYYLNQKTLTFESTPSDAQSLPVRLYKTGDYGRFCINKDKDDIDVQFIGRKDRQKKLKGARIELDGVQQIIKTHPYIKDAIVLLAQNQERLVTFVTLKDDINQHISEKDLRVALIKHLVRTPLPLIAFPQNIIVLTAMPLNINGKIDMKALEEIEIQYSKKQNAPEIPRENTPFEKKLFPIWKRALGLTEANIEHTALNVLFIELGGSSIELVALQNCIIEQRNTLLLNPELSDFDIKMLIQPEMSLSTLALSLEKHVVKNTNNSFTPLNTAPSQSQFLMFSNEAKQSNSDKTEAGLTVTPATDNKSIMKT